jgi:hypothetical protein
MIEYGSTSLGARHLNQNAKNKKDALQQILKGMKCNKCEENSFIEFVEDGKRARAIMNFCCQDFEQKVNEKLRSSVP